MAYKTEKKYYEWLEEPGNEHRLHRFGHAMNGTRYWEVEENVVHSKLRLSEHRVDLLRAVLIMTLFRISVEGSPEGVCRGRRGRWYRVCLCRTGHSIPGIALCGGGQVGSSLPRPSGTPFVRVE